MTSRSLSASFFRDLNKQESPEAALIFLTISHPNLASDIYVVSDSWNYVVGSNTFLGFPFDITLLTDTESPPSATLTLQNVDRKIGNAILELLEPPRLKIEVIAVSEFDETADPRTELSAPATVEYTADQLYLLDVDVNGSEVSARIVSWSYVQESWPGLRCTSDRTPALWR